MSTGRTARETLLSLLPHKQVTYKHAQTDNFILGVGLDTHTHTHTGTDRLHNRTV